MQEELLKLRDKIDWIDREILKLLLKRVEAVREVGDLKSRNHSRIYVPERENSIFQKIYELANRGGFEGEIEKEELASVYTEIISFCRARERKISVLTENDNCFFIAHKIFGNCIEVERSTHEKIWENFSEKIDFLIVRLDEKNLEKIFVEKKYPYIISKVDFLGESYIILGKDPNSCTEESYVAFLGENRDGKIRFVEKKASPLEQWIGDRIPEQLKDEGIEKFLGYYEIRKLS